MPFLDVTHLVRSSLFTPSPRTAVRFPFRHLVTTPIPLAYKPQAAHPSRKAPRDHTSGSAVSDTSKEDESTRSGIPKSDERPSMLPPPSAYHLLMRALPLGLATVPVPKLFDLSNRTVVITGGGRGLGLTIVQALLESGASVAALDILPEPSEPAWSASLSLAQRSGLNLTYLQSDVTDSHSVNQTISEVFSSAPSSQPVTGLFLAAGITSLVHALDYSAEQFRKIIDVNLTGSFLCAQAFAREYTSRNPTPASESGMNDEGRMYGQGGASIVMTGSMSGTVANLGLDCAAYNASKAGVNQLGRNLATEWGRKGIRVNVGPSSHSEDLWY